MAPPMMDILALVNIAAPDGEAAIDDGGDCRGRAEHHDHGQTVADAGLEVGGTERRALAKAETALRANRAATVMIGRSRERSLGASIFFISLLVRAFIFLFLPAAHAANYA